jgi:transposase, IS30 family
MCKLLRQCRLCFRINTTRSSFIQNRVAISERPPEADDRSSPGHWEADLMMFAKYGQAVLTLHERASRLILAQRPANKTADLVAAILADLLALFPQPLRQTITFDNGTEFARHYQLAPLAKEQHR